MSILIRINLTKENITSEPVPEKYNLLGGRALTSRLILDEVDPCCEPLGLRNKLIFAPGLLSGSYLSSSSRLSVGSKSPLTGGIKEANAGGTAAASMSKLGIKALVIEGESCRKLNRYLYVSKDCIELRSAELAGQGVYNSSKILFERYGKNVSIIIIGPGGERGFSASGITNTDIQGRPSRFMGRGGLGAVMGVKGLKAIVIDPTGAESIKYHDRKAFQDLNKKIIKLLKENPATGEIYPKYGTAAMATRTNMLHALPTRNFSAGEFEFANRIDGEFLYQLISNRGGKGETTHSCMPGCVIKCSNVYVDLKGEEVVAPLEYETIGLMGSNLGIGNLDEIARLNYLCNDLGLDTIEMGAAIGVAMDQGILPFGDAEKAADLLSEVAADTILGKVLGHGALVTGKILGSRRIPVAKGQAMPAYDPRSIKGLGVTYATSPMGADHTAGNTIRVDVDHTDPAPQPGLSLNAQVISMVADSMGLCLFVMPVLNAHLDILGNICEYYSGVRISGEELRKQAEKTLNIEREFNKLAGISPSLDRLPEFMMDEPLPVTGSVFDVPIEELLKVNE